MPIVNQHKKGNQNMLNIKKLSLAAVLVAGLAFNASALNITPGTFSPWTGTDNSNLSAAQIGAIVGVTPLSMVYNQEIQGESSGLTINENVSTAGSIFLYVKDGNHNPAFYIFNLTGVWNGTDALVLSGFWPGPGSISHVSLYTGPGTQRVPDAGGTLALMGVALGSLGLLRRKFAA
jgi:hypothetical protein